MLNGLNNIVNFLSYIFDNLLIIVLIIDFSRKNLYNKAQVINTINLDH